jgi:DNA-binding XRE family transcriptional regulator
LEAIKEEEREIRRALDENAARAAEAISVEEASIEKLEQKEAEASLQGELAMSPFT